MGGRANDTFIEYINSLILSHYFLNMKTQLTHCYFAFIIFLQLCHPALGQVVVELPQASQRAGIRQRIGLTDIEVDYSRPAVNGRKTWGNIVPCGFTSPTVDGKDEAPWKTGANMNTTVSFSHDVTLEGHRVDAGTYGFFVAMHDDGTATVVLSKTHNAYGHYFYKQEEDVLRTAVKTRTTTPTEWLTFSFDEVGAKYTVLSLKWDAVEIPVKIEVDVFEVVKVSLIEQLKQPATFTWQGRVQAIRYLIDNKVHLDLALQWADEALNGSPGGELLTGERNFTTLTTKYHVLNALNRDQEGKAYLQEALANPGNVPPERVASFGTNLLVKNRKQDAQLVFEWAVIRWPSSWETKHGMARVYAADGKYKQALTLEREIYKQTPEDQKVIIANNIKLLEQKKDFNK